MSLSVRVITPEKVFLTSDTDQVVLPSITGGVGILKGHAPLVTILEAGVLRYKNNGSWTPAVLYGGFAEVDDDQVTVLVNGAEEVVEGNNLAEIEKALIDATANLEEIKKTVSEDRKLKPEILKVQIAKARFEATKMLKG
jgi:F-type H+-transporting ATPase subunit epsilon